MSLSVLLISTLISGIAFVVLVVLPWRSSPLRLLPLPPGAATLWGHEKTIFMDEPGRVYRKWIKEIGLTFRIKAAFGAPDILVVSDPEGIAHILQKRIYDYHHSAVVRPRVARLLGKGLGWVEGEEEHKRMRRITRPALTADNVKAMSPDIIEAATQVISDLVRLVQDSGSRVEVDAIDWAGKATLNVIGRVAFLHDFNQGNSEEARRILNARKSSIPAAATYFGYLTLMLLRRFPFLNNLPIPQIQRQGLAKTTIQSGVAKELVNRYQHLADESSDRENYQQDLLSRLRESASSFMDSVLFEHAVRASSEEKLSVSELYEQISTFIISGFETTTATLSFSIWELARHPDKQQRLREELSTINGDPTFNDFQNGLPYLHAVLKETLRLYPALPYMERVATKPDVIPLRQPLQLANGQVVHHVVVRPGQTVLIPIIAIHRQDSIWADADTFRPERWLEDLPPQEQLCSGWGNLLAFSDGPRSCIGIQLALFNYKTILSSWIRQIQFEDTGLEMSLKISSSLQPWVRGDRDKQGRNQVPIYLRSV
ncbi:cytochrome P450 [Desarmillaria tabescens]|uniref:Cytochrome P450 n=1 Tax=Armillaria tabescens TaxID=1929756 RepID=A0AA39N7N7_ARMTA|nr:cytochrome P450 [Desarmillaria tabescens]KAK0460546.1 cytochrome P450 [Desarmillaria tabescens]